MAKVRWVIPCLVATIDRETNAVTLTHILEGITVSPDVSTVEPGKVMLIQPGFAMVSLWERSIRDKPEKVPARLSIFGPQKQRVAGGETLLDLTAAPQARWVSRLAHFPYTGPGDYDFQLHAQTGSRWVRAGRTSITVKLGEKAPEPKQGSIADS